MAALDLDFRVGLRAFDLSVALRAGAEVLALAGPSGAGKTTVLRAVAGLVRPRAGRIALGERVWFDSERRRHLAPERRAVGLVPQHYALFPHLTVRKNVGFAGSERVDELLERMRIAHLAGARPRTLSGGESQRVAIARALARDPAVLLLDEPLSALDAHTRLVVRDELAELLATLGLPTLLVTHDFRDAAALADRIAVIVEGRLLQTGTAAELLERPADPFVAAYTGAAVVAGVADGLRIALDGGELRCTVAHRGPVWVAVHPWEVEVRREPGGLEAVVAGVQPEGPRVRVRAGGFVAECPAPGAPRRGERVWLRIAPEHVRVLDVRRSTGGQMDYGADRLSGYGA